MQIANSLLESLPCKWGEFKIAELFKVECSKYHNPNNYSNGNIPYVARTTFNNGVIKNIDTQEHLYPANCIIIGAESAKAFYQKKPFLTGNKIYRLYLKNKFGILNESIALFICTLINKVGEKYNYTEAFISSRIEQESIFLPITSQQKPDFTLMQNFIKDIEQSHTEKLIKYYEFLQSNRGGGLRFDYKKYLAFIVKNLDSISLNNPKNIEFKEFRIGDLFEIANKPILRNKADIDINGRIPIYSSDTSNGGIIGYCNKLPSFKISNATPIYVIFGDHTRAMNIAKTDFCVTDNVKVLIPKYASEQFLLYVFAVWKKCIPNLGYARHWNIAKNALFPLPVHTNGQIAFDIMDDFIKNITINHNQKLIAHYGILTNTNDTL